MSATATILGRIAEPVLRWTQGGHAVLELSIAATPRRKNRQTGDWEDDGAPLWINATLWDAEAEAAHELLRKGDPVIATGTLALETYTTKNGQPGQKLMLRFPKVAKEPRPTPTHGAPANNHPPPTMTTSRTGTTGHKRWRAAVLKRDRAAGQTTCPTCGVTLAWDTSLQPDSPEPDHITPWSLGGTNTLDNGRTICRRCNQRRGNGRNNAPKRRRTGTTTTLVAW